MRFLSRQVICRIGSTPTSITIFDAASALMWARAPAPSVRFTASAKPRSGVVLRIRSCGLLETGGATSAVITKRPVRSFSAKVLGTEDTLSFIACSFRAAEDKSDYMVCASPAIVPGIARFLDRTHPPR
jgi:hypothetical protein